MELKPEEWVRIKEIFQSTLELEPDARSSFLSREGGSDAVRELVADLIRAHEEAGTFLNLKASSPNGDWVAVAVAPGQRGFAADDLLAERFRIVRFLAKGGMGEVYEAEDLELRTRVAIKTIRPEIAGVPHALDRFKREVHLAKQVTHPNVCRIFDLFRHRDPSSPDSNAIFVSMELLRGRTLAERIKETGRLSPEEVLQLLRQIVPALGAAHAAGILHRDLKPGNILLEPARDGGIRAVITDFGLAWSLDSNAEAPLTRSGQPGFGTPEYMSPEQIEGKEITPASDLYSLGLVIYQMVTGAKAFGGDTPLFAALRRMTEAPPPPSEIVPEAGSQWDFLVSRCLNPDPKQRFASAHQLTEMLEASAKDPPRMPSGKRSSAVERMWFSRRWRFAAFALGGCAVAAAAVLLVLHWRHKPAATTNLTIVLADFVNTTGEPAFDNTLNLALAAKLQQSPFLTLMPDAKIRMALRYMSLPARERLTQMVAREVCQRGGGQVVLQGSIANNAKGYMVTLRAVQCQSGASIAVKQSPVEFRDSVLDALDQVAEAMRPSLGESLDSIHKYDVPLGEATTGSIEALAAFSEGTLKWNAEGEAAALPYFERATEIDPNFALAYARLGTVYGNMGETQRSDDAMRKAYDRRDRVTEWERYYITSHFYGFVTGEVDKEMRTYEEWAEAYPHDMAWTINLSVDYGFTGQLDKAIELQRRAIQEIPGLSPSYGDLAQFYLAADRPDEARAVLDQALQIHVQDANTQLAEYSLSFYRNDAAAMSKLLTAAAQQPGIGDMLLAQQATTEDRRGRLSAGLEFAAKAAAAAARAGNVEIRANWLAGEAVRQAEMGSPEEARRLVAEALAIPNAARGRDVQTLVALASAQTGDLKRAQTMLGMLAQGHPLDTLIQSYWVPVLRARIAFAESRYAQAVHALDGTGPYDLGIFIPGQCMDAAFVRGQALLAGHQGTAAAAEFRNVLAHRGLVLNCPTSTLSQLGLARSLALSGDASGSRTAYQDLFVIWKDADQDFSLLRQAETEYRALQ
jgi:serine/threonine protein kinase/tetratricopeptide (TPR) repeat protein